MIGNWLKTVFWKKVLQYLEVGMVIRLRLFNVELGEMDRRSSSLCRVLFP